MRFSIIIPVYNVEEYLGQCLDSIAHQDYSDYEVVIVDDGSTDGSASIYERFAAEADVPVRIVKQENKGLLLARRAGIKAANGDYYCTSTATTVWRPMQCVRFPGSLTNWIPTSC